MSDVVRLRSAAWKRLGERIGRLDHEWHESVMEDLEKLVELREERMRLHRELGDIFGRRGRRKMTGS